MFQDLDDFCMGGYVPLSDVESGMARPVEFLSAAARDAGGSFRNIGSELYELLSADGRIIRFTTNRETVKDDSRLELPWIDHPAPGR